MRGGVRLANLLNDTPRPRIHHPSVNLTPAWIDRFTCIMDQDKNQKHMMDLTSENITENVKWVNEAKDKPRLSYVMERLVTHLHDFARETRCVIEETPLPSFSFMMSGIPMTTSSTRSSLVLIHEVFRFHYTDPRFSQE